MSDHGATFTILFEDDALIVVDKPPGLLSFPRTQGKERNLADLVRSALKQRNQACFPVHRLDRDTSGVILFAKTERAKEGLESAFRGGSVAKTYLAIVNGIPHPKNGTVRSFIVDRGDTAFSSKKPVPGGKTAITHYRTLELLRGGALIEAHPETGRFNQIRLHCVDMRCPIAGERKYSVASRHVLKAKRVMLHAHKLELPHPIESARALAFESPLPSDFETLLRDSSRDDR